MGTRRRLARWFDQLVAAHPVNRSAVTSERVALIGVAFFVLLFAVVWGPLYFFGVGLQLLFPIWLPFVLVVWILAAVAIVFGVIGMVRAAQVDGDGRRSALRGVIAGAVLLIVALPALWFGGAPADPIEQDVASAGSLELDAAEFTLPTCAGYAPVDVAALDGDIRASCEPVGADLIFPDGTHLTLPDHELGSAEMLGSTDRGAHLYGYEAVGIYGIYATRRSADCSEFQEWGSPEAKRRVHEAYGDDYPCS